MVAVRICAAVCGKVLCLVALGILLAVIVTLAVAFSAALALSDLLKDRHEVQLLGNVVLATLDVGIAVIPACENPTVIRYCNNRRGRSARLNELLGFTLNVATLVHRVGDRNVVREGIILNDIVKGGDLATIGKSLNRRHRRAANRRDQCKTYDYLGNSHLNLTIRDMLNAGLRIFSLYLGHIGVVLLQLEHCNHTLLKAETVHTLCRILERWLKLQEIHEQTANESDRRSDTDSQPDVAVVEHPPRQRGKKVRGKAHCKSHEDRLVNALENQAQIVLFHHLLQIHKLYVPFI